MKQCFPLMMYWFYSDNALCFSFTVFIFLLSPFDTWDRYYFESSLSVLMYIKVLLKKKHKILFYNLLNMEKQFCLMCLFPCWLPKKINQKWKVGEKRYAGIKRYINVISQHILYQRHVQDVWYVNVWKTLKNQIWCLSKFKTLLECPSALSVQVPKCMSALSAQVCSKYLNVT